MVIASSLKARVSFLGEHEKNLQTSLDVLCITSDLLARAIRNRETVSFRSECKPEGGYRIQINIGRKDTAATPESPPCVEPVGQAEQEAPAEAAQVTPQQSQQAE